MTQGAPKPVTALLLKYREGDARALDRLLPMVYDELRNLARHYMSDERPGHTLQATALVHEAYARLVDSDAGWQDRVQFFAVAARTMRRVLVDHAKGKQRQKRGARPVRITLESGTLGTPPPSLDILALDEALQRLAAQDERKAKAVELHHFGGLTRHETAAALEVSAATVDRDLRMARAWLHHELTDSPEAGDPPSDMKDSPDESEPR